MLAALELRYALIYLFALSCQFSVVRILKKSKSEKISVVI